MLGKTCKGLTDAMLTGQTERLSARGSRFSCREIADGTMTNPVCRHLVLVLGDQLDAGAAALRDLDPARDRVWMCEAVEESTHVPSHKARILLFLSAMRHFRDALKAIGIRVHYRALEIEADPSLGADLAAAIRVLRPERLILTEPGEHRVLAAIQAVSESSGVPLEIRPDGHFILIQQRFPDAPGTLERFDWPVTVAQAREALDDFIRNRLVAFGPWQDAMWTGEPYLYHAWISAALNLKLLDPRTAIDAAIAAFEANQAPLASVEGFVRQILGWREYVRGISRGWIQSASVRFVGGRRGFVQNLETGGRG
jgi:deoxyribodipyrimidine photolyase-like uncharacterized protein